MKRFIHDNPQLQNLTSCISAINNYNALIETNDHRHHFELQDVSPIVQMSDNSYRAVGEVCSKCGFIRNVNFADIPCQCIQERHVDFRNIFVYVENQQHNDVITYPEIQAGGKMAYYLGNDLTEFRFKSIVECKECKFPLQIDICSFIVKNCNTQILHPLTTHMKTFINNYQPLSTTRSVTIDLTTPRTDMGRKYFDYGFKRNHMAANGQTATDYVFSSVCDEITNYNDEHFRIEHVDGQKWDFIVVEK